MRFKAKLSNHQVSSLHSLFTVLSKLGENSITLRLDANHFRLLLNSQTNQDTSGIIAFAEYENNRIFLDHKIESKAENNCISMKLELSQIKLAFRTILSKEKDADIECPIPAVWKLAKRQNTPCLCLDGMANHIQIHQAVPVVLSPEHSLNIPPVPNEPDLQVELPSQNSLRILLDKSKHSTNVVYLVGKISGELLVQLYTESGSFVQSHLSNLKIISGTDTTVKVDIRKLTATLASPCTLCMVENETLILHNTMENTGSLIYFLPVHYHTTGDHPCDNNE